MPNVAVARPSKRERFLGCLLGQPIGDATGAPLEDGPRGRTHVADPATRLLESYAAGFGTVAS
jgi:ADP-ribosylglycohydrolase